MSGPSRIAASTEGLLALALLWPVARHLVFPQLAAGPWVGVALFVVLPLAALRGSWRSALGLDRFDGVGVAVGLGGTLAMALAFVLAGSAPSAPEPEPFVRGTVAAAVAEEILFRGYAVGRLRVHARWPLAAAIGVPAALFGLGHLAGALAAGEAGNPVMTVLVTTAGGAWFGWLMSRWRGSLWVPIAVHAAMNAWWMLFAAGPTAGASGAAALWGRVAAITIISVLTARLTRGREAEIAG